MPTTREQPRARQLAQDLLQALLRQLEDVPFLEVGSVLRNELVGGREIDLMIDLQVPGEPGTRLIGEIKSTGEPRYARAATDQLFFLTHRTCPGTYGVFLAPYISPEAAAICEAGGFGYLDLAGNCLLTFGHVYVRREGRPKIAAQKRILRSLYSPKAERVLRALLSEPGKSWRLQELAARAEVSLGQAHNVKTLLRDREWLTEASGLRLREPSKLLQEWAEHYDFNRSARHGFHSLHTPREVETSLSEFCAKKGLKYAFTGFSGAARAAPHARYQRVHAYVSVEGRTAFAEAAGLQPVSSGANVILLDPYDEGVYYGSQDRDGCVVTPIQLYLDLCALSGRGEDAAEFLLDTVLRPQW